MSIKVDQKKAYDRLSWLFIQDTLLAVGFPSSLNHDMYFFNLSENFMEWWGNIFLLPRGIH